MHGPHPPLFADDKGFSPPHFPGDEFGPPYFPPMHGPFAGEGMKAPEEEGGTTQPPIYVKNEKKEDLNEDLKSYYELKAIPAKDEYIVGSSSGDGFLPFSRSHVQRPIPAYVKKRRNKYRMLSPEIKRTAVSLVSPSFTHIA